LKEKRHPEITRREFMGSTWKLLNVGAFIALGGHLGSLAVTSISSGHPDTMTCYECRACASPCPWKLDPSGYLVAARVNNPDRRMLAQYNVQRYNWLIGNREEDRRMTLDALYDRDPRMKVVIGVVKKREQIELFTITAEYDEFRGYLREGEIDENLRELFDERRRSLSSKAEMTWVEDHWEIVDGNDRYIIEDTGAALNITGEKKEYEKEDPMQAERAKEKLIELISEGKDAELTDIYEMRAKDSAFYDPLCARCEPACPVALPVTKFIRDVKADEKYR
jgi:ferredoxin